MTGANNVAMCFPRRLFEEGREPIPTKSINYWSKTELFESLHVFLGPELWSEVKGSPLGVIIRFYELDFVWCSRIIHYLLSRQLVTKKKYELWFLVEGQPLRFTLKDFVEVTGLNSVGEEDVHTGASPTEFLNKLGLSERRVSPTLNDLRSVFSSGRIKSREDKLRVAYLVIVASVLLGRDRRGPIPLQYVRLVSDLQKFEAYPWAKAGLKALIAAVRKTDFVKNSYVVNGFVQVLQVWAYLVIPKVGHDFGVKLKDEGLPLLRYKGSKGKKISFDDLGEIDTSRLGSRESEWEDEEEDVEVDNVLRYYGEHMSFSQINWVPDAAIGSKISAPTRKDNKRKGKEVVDEGSSRGKQRRRYNFELEERVEVLETELRMLKARFDEMRRCDSGAGPAFAVTTSPVRKPTPSKSRAKLKSPGKSKPAPKAAPKPQVPRKTNPTTVTSLETETTRETEKDTAVADAVDEPATETATEPSGGNVPPFLALPPTRNRPCTRLQVHRLKQSLV